MADDQKPSGLDLETAAKLGNLFHGLAHNPKTRRAVAKVVREVLPDSPEARSFSDVEIEDKFETFKQEQEDKEIQRQQKSALARMNAQRSQLLTGGHDGSGRKYSEDDVSKIEKLMEKKGIVDYEDGAILYASTLPPDDPKPARDMPGAHGATWEFPEWAKFGPDPVKASRDTANQVITELMRSKR